jgi:outer membrane protein
MRARRACLRLLAVGVCAAATLDAGASQPGAGSDPASETVASADPIDWPALRDDLAANASLALGVTTSFTPSYAGSNDRKVAPHLVWAFQYGRIRLSTGGGAAVLGIAQDPRGPGASAELFSTNRLRAGVAFRIDRGRDSSAIDGLEDLPDVDATVRGRAYASYALTPNWTVAGAIAPDLLGRGGGTVGTLDIGYRAPLTPASEWYAGAGVTLADATYMNSYYGVSPETAATTGRPAYEAGAGASGVRAAIGFTAALTSRWILVGGVGVTQLLGYAAGSPLTQQQTAVSASLGIAYRWGAKYEGLTSVLLPAAEQPR